eukprot:3148077-Heterocapsa_arctica.AAC.1
MGDGSAGGVGRQDGGPLVAELRSIASGQAGAPHALHASRLVLDYNRAAQLLMSARARAAP